MRLTVPSRDVKSGTEEEHDDEGLNKRLVVLRKNNNSIARSHVSPSFSGNS